MRRISLLTHRESLKCGVAVWDRRECRFKRGTSKQATHDTLVITKKHIPATRKEKYKNVFPNIYCAIGLLSQGWRSHSPNTTRSRNHVLDPCWFCPPASESVSQRSKRGSEWFHFSSSEGNLAKIDSITVSPENTLREDNVPSIPRVPRARLVRLLLI